MSKHGGNKTSKAAPKPPMANKGPVVKVEVRFRGREATHPEVARAQIASIADGVADIAMVERAPSLEGRTMFAILARGRAQQPLDQPRLQADTSHAVAEAGRA